MEQDRKRRNKNESRRIVFGRPLAIDVVEIVIASRSANIFDALTYVERAFSQGGNFLADFSKRRDTGRNVCATDIDPCGC